MYQLWKLFWGLSLVPLHMSFPLRCPLHLSRGSRVELAPVIAAKANVKSMEAVVNFMLMEWERDYTVFCILCVILPDRTEGGWLFKLLR
jgi:hypothetical protein